MSRTLRQPTFKKCCRLVLLTQLASFAAVQAQAQQADGPVAIVDDRVLTVEDLEHVIGNRLLQLRSQLYLRMRLALDELIAESLFKVEAERQGLSVAELNDRLEASTPPVTDQELRLVFEATPDRFPNLSEAQALEALRTSMRERRLQQRRMELVKELRAKAEVRILLEPVRATLPERTGPFIGPATAPVTIVVFSDYQCPFCRQMAPVFKELLRAFDGQVKLIHRDMPLPNHPQSTAAAEAAHCAGDQGRYWEMYDLLFENQRGLGSSFYLKAARELGLDAAAFLECVSSGKHASVWQEGLLDAWLVRYAFLLRERPPLHRHGAVRSAGTGGGRRGASR